MIERRYRWCWKLDSVDPEDRTWSPHLLTTRGKWDTGKSWCLTWGPRALTIIRGLQTPRQTHTNHHQPH